jgi:hypothetical protein
MSDDAKFKVGDRVQKQRHAYGVTFSGNVAVVARVGKRKVTLDDGSEWNVSGIAWGAKPERGVGLSHAWQIEVVR